MKICLLASGSKANSLYIESHGTAIIIDQGLPHKEFINRLSLRNLDSGKIKGILVTHEHGDHVKGVGITARKLGVPIYATEDTLKKIDNKLSGIEEVLPIESGKLFSIGKMKILPFSVSHDAIDPVQFQITSKNKHIATATDLGFISTIVQDRLKECDLVIIESNYDVDMLRKNPSYPVYLKNRIESIKGHLSNRNTAETIFNITKNGRPKVILSHLSRENNRPDVAEKAVRDLFEDYDKRLGFLLVAKQDEPTPVIEI